MTTFKSRQVNLDPAPYRAVKGGVRSGENVAEGMRRIGVEVVYDARPEYEPTRDPYPWLIVGDGLTESDDYRLASPDWTSFWEPSKQEALWRPRREQFDTPVNPILEAFRKRVEREGANGLNATTLAKAWTTGSVITRVQYDLGASQAQTIHARKVLTRLANFTKGGMDS